MKKIILSYVAALFGAIVLGAGIFFLSTQGYYKQADVVLGAGAFCLSGCLPGAAFTRSRVHAVALSSLVTLGVMILSIGIFSLILLENQDQYYGHTLAVFELFALWLLGGLATAIVVRSRGHFLAFCSLAAIAVFVLGAGLYFRVVMNYHGRAYVALGSGSIFLLLSLTGMLIALLHSRVRKG